MDRIVAAVADLEKAVDFFSDLLGIDFDLPVEEFDSLGVRGVSSSFGLQLESPLGWGPNLMQKFIEDKGEGVFAFVFKVDSIEEGIKHFRERGLEVVNDWRGGGLRQAFFHPKDTYGVQIALAEYKAPHPANCAYRHPEAYRKKALPRMRIERIERYTLGIADLEKAINFFSDLLCMEFDPVGEPHSLGIKGVYSTLGLELLAPLGRGPRLIEQFIEKRGEGVFDLTMTVDDMEEGIKHFTERGLRVVGDWTGGGMREVGFHPKETCGIQIVLAEYKAPHRAMCAYRHPET